MFKMENVIIIKRDSIGYPKTDLGFLPSEDYPELAGIINQNSSEKNIIFDMVRDGLKLSGLDSENIDSESWNPMADGLIKEGDVVLVKPNLVLDYNKSGAGLDPMITNKSLVGAIIPYIWKALKKNGEILVADAPIQACDFDKLIDISGYKSMIKYYQSLGMNIHLKDLRGLVGINDNGIVRQAKTKNNGVLVDLSDYSEHALLSEDYIKRERITSYDPGELNSHHSKSKHEYLVSEDMIRSDVIINMPKPKSHRMAGVTIGMKNFVGINTRKEYLPHHRMGSRPEGGDEYENKSIIMTLSSHLMDLRNIEMVKRHNLRARTCYVLSRGLEVLSRGLNKDHVQFTSGSWHGNDTIWRTIIDLNKIVQYADKNGIMRESPQRKIFNIGDMVVIGEKEGPMSPSAKYGGIIAMGNDIVAFDEIITTLFGFDINKVPLYRNVGKIRDKYKLKKNDNIIIKSNYSEYNGKGVGDFKLRETLCIEPTSGFKGHIELKC